MKYFLFAVLFFTQVAMAETKLVSIGGERYVEYDASDEMKTFKKNMPVGFGAEAIKVIKDKSFEIQSTFLIIRDDNVVYFRANSPEIYISEWHSKITDVYASKSEEGIDSPKKIVMNNGFGLISTFTDKSLLSKNKFSKMLSTDVDYKYITLITGLIGDQKSGIAATIAILSHEISGTDYDLALSTVKSIRIKSER